MVLNVFSHLNMTELGIPNVQQMFRGLLMVTPGVQHLPIVMAIAAGKMKILIGGIVVETSETNVEDFVFLYVMFY